MTYEEKLDKIIYKLSEETKYTRKNHKTLVYFTDRSFTKINLDEISKILFQLQDDEKIITIIDDSPPDGIPNIPDDQVLAETICVEITEKFNSWYARYLLRQKSKIQNLSVQNFYRAFHTLVIIEDALQVSTDSRVTIDFDDFDRKHKGYSGPVSGRFTKFQEYDIKGVKYLNKLGVIEDYSPFRGHSKMEVRVNIPKMNQFYLRALDRKTKLKEIDDYNEEYLEFIGQSKENNQDASAKQKTDNKPTNDPVVHEIVYTKSREVLLDGKLLLAKPDFSSENDLVFDYLYKNPNKRITKTKLEKEVVKEKLTKTLHKIVENLGFKKTLRNAFFDVSQKAIMFRNPLTQKDMKDLGIDKIKL